MLNGTEAVLTEAVAAGRYRLDLYIDRDRTGRVDRLTRRINAAREARRSISTANVDALGRHDHRAKASNGATAATINAQGRFARLSRSEIFFSNGLLKGSRRR